MKTPSAGQMVEIRIGDTWLPYLITHVIDEEIVSGVAFSGRFRDHGWSHCCGNFGNIHRGEGNRNWRGVEEKPPVEDEE